MGGPRFRLRWRIHRLARRRITWMGERFVLRGWVYALQRPHSSLSCALAVGARQCLERSSECAAVGWAGMGGSLHWHALRQVSGEPAVPSRMRRSVRTWLLRERTGTGRLRTSLVNGKPSSASSGQRRRLDHRVVRRRLSCLADLSGCQCSADLSTSRRRRRAARSGRRPVRT